MSHRCVASTAALAAIVAIGLLAPAPASSQALSSAAKVTATGKTFTPARTPDGQPDLQGVWTNNTVTPLQRPKELAGKEFYTEEELAAVIKKERQRLDLDRASLELQETKLLSPARLEELAKMQQFIDPAPQKVVYLDNKSEQKLAQR